VKILLVAPFFPPQQAVASLRTYSFARTWADAGHDVTVLTTKKRPDQGGLAKPFVGLNVVELPYRGPWYLELMRRAEHTLPPAGTSVTVARRTLKGRLVSPLRYLKRRTGIFSAVRQPDLTDGWVRPAVEWARTDGPWDAVVSSGGPSAAHLAALRIKLAGLARTWAADFRDLWTGNHLYPGLFPFTLLERLREKRVLANADRLVTVSDGLADWLARKSGKPADVIFNGYDAESFRDLNPEPAFPPDGRVRLVYTGTVYPAGQSIAELCDAVAKEPQATLVVASDRPDLWNSAREKYALGDRLDFRGSIPRAEALRLQRDASALILLDWYEPRHGVLTGKLFEYLLSPAPIWVVGGADESPATRLVQRAGRGFAFGKDVEKVRRAIRGLAHGQGEAITPDQAFIASLSREDQALRLLQLLGEPAM
jgi:glycosyltransferase involved in cell wall biosynthesis